MVIEACQYEVESDRFIMSVHLEDGVQVSYCNGGEQRKPSPESPSFMRGGSSDSNEGPDALLIVAIIALGFVLYLGFCLLNGNKRPEEAVVDC